MDRLELYRRASESTCLAYVSLLKEFHAFSNSSTFVGGVLLAYPSITSKAESLPITERVRMHAAAMVVGYSFFLARYFTGNSPAAAIASTFLMLFGGLSSLSR